MMNWNAHYNSYIKCCHLILFFAITLTVPGKHSMSYCFLLMVLQCSCDVVIL